MADDEMQKLKTTSKTCSYPPVWDTAVIKTHWCVERLLVLQNAAPYGGPLLKRSEFVLFCEKNKTETGCLPRSSDIDITYWTLARRIYKRNVYSLVFYYDY